MRKFIEKLIRRHRRNSARYEREKLIARSRDVRARISLAGDSRTHQEILYYLAGHDPDPAVKRALVKNPATPVQASPILASDSNEDVRLALAGRLVQLLPELNAERHSQLYAYAVQALGILALDEMIKIRKAISSVLQDYGDAPPGIVSQLARDVEREVSEPILKFCTAVSDEVLLDLLSGYPESWAVQAIAGRRQVSSRISQAVIDTGDRPAGAILIGNKGAVITRATLEQIVERARDYPEWQIHLAVRAGLPPEMAKTLARYADRKVRDLLLKREDFEPQLANELADIFSRRLDFVEKGERVADMSPLARAKEMHTQGRLTEEVIADALGMREHAFVCSALACLAGTDPEIVTKIFDLKSPRLIVALTWKAGLPMRFALRLQKDIGHIQPRQLIYPRDGTDYPLTRDELIWQLDFVGIETA